MFGIEDKDFIDVSLNFVITKDMDKKDVAEKLFDSFNKIAMDNKTPKDTFLKGFLPKMITTKVPMKIVSKDPNAVVLGGSFPVDTKVYVRTRKFEMIKISKPTLLKQVDEKIEMKQTEDEDAIGVCVKSNYSPKDLAKDIRFIGKFNMELLESFHLKKMNYSYFSRKGNEIFLKNRQDTIEFEYPLKKRLELSKKNKELDEFIFPALKGSVQDALKNIKDEQVKKEVMEMIEV
jgi:hypothetical protein